MNREDPLAMTKLENRNAFGLAYLHISEPHTARDVVIHEGQQPVASKRIRKLFNRETVG